MRTATALYDDYDAASRALSRLEDAGFASDDISIVSHRSEEDTNAAEGAGVGAGLGAAVGGAGGLLAGLGMLAIPGVGPVVAAGWLAATAAGAVGGAVVGGVTGGIIGSLTESGVSEEDANLYAEGIRRGGTLVSARVPDDRYAEAEAILANENSVDIADRRRRYRDEGWEHFDESAEPYTDEDIDRERKQYLS